MFNTLLKHRGEVHRRIGWLMLVFQDVERMLKFILAAGAISAPISRLESVHKGRVAKYSEKAMGQVIDAFIKEFFQSKNDSQLELDVITEVHLRATIVLSMDDDAKSRFLKSLERIRLVRNEIAHGLAQQIDLSTKDGCKNASAMLEDKWESVKPDIEQLRVMFISCRDAILRSHSEHENAKN